jgi:hypothetical protein
VYILLCIFRGYYCYYIYIEMHTHRHTHTHTHTHTNGKFITTIVYISLYKCLHCQVSRGDLRRDDRALKHARREKRLFRPPVQVEAAVTHEETFDVCHVHSDILPKTMYKSPNIEYFENLYLLPRCRFPNPQTYSI